MKLKFILTNGYVSHNLYTMPREPEEVVELKEIINQGGDLELFKSRVQEIFCSEEVNPSADISYIFQKVFLHACLKIREDIADWMQNVCFPLLPTIEQISIRQCFSYGRHLLRQKWGPCTQ
jgi:hypothetical protein